MELNAYRIYYVNIDLRDQISILLAKRPQLRGARRNGYYRMLAIVLPLLPPPQLISPLPYPLSSTSELLPQPILRRFFVLIPRAAAGKCA